MASHRHDKSEPVAMLVDQSTGNAPAEGLYDAKPYAVSPSVRSNRAKRRVSVEACGMRQFRYSSPSNYVVDVTHNPVLDVCLL